MIGAGMIKLRGDDCWRNLTCMYWFHETQPIPNPIAYFMHFSPRIFLMFETFVNHFVELVVPWLMFVPIKNCIRFAGVMQIGFMFGIYVSGNLSFLNVLTMVPSLACFDDEFLDKITLKVFRTSKSLKNSEIRVSSGPSRVEAFFYSNQIPSKIQKLTDLLLVSLITYLSLPVVSNLFSRAQIMNTSFNSFKIVNTYGAFGSVTIERYEIIVN